MCCVSQEYTLGTRSIWHLVSKSSWGCIAWHPLSTKKIYTSQVLQMIVVSLSRTVIHKNISIQGKRCSVSAHLSSSTEEHLKLTFSELFRTREVVDVMRKDYRYLLQSFKQLEEKNSALEKQIVEMKQTRKEKRRQYRHCEKASSMHGEV